MGKRTLKLCSMLRQQQHVHVSQTLPVKWRQTNLPTYRSSKQQACPLSAKVDRLHEVAIGRNPSSCLCLCSTRNCTLQSALKL